MRVRRAIRNVVAYALLGVAATVLSSWALHEVQQWRAIRAARHTPWHLPEASTNAGHASPSGHRIAGPWRAHRRVPPGFEWAELSRAGFFWRSSWSGRGWEASVEAIRIEDATAWPPRGTHERLMWYRIGWPLPTVELAAYNGLFYDSPTHRVETITPGASVGGGVQVLPWPRGPVYHTPQLYPRRDLSERRAIPLRPIWPGFLLNSAAFASLLFLVLRAPRAVRRAIRRRRGRCGACGYDRAGLAPHAACPECGAGPPAPAATRAAAGP